MLLRRAMHSLARHRARVNTLLFSVDRILLTPKKDVQSYLMTRLSNTEFDNEYRPIAFARLLRFSLQRRLFTLALALHHRMRSEGFLLPNPLALRIAALGLATDLPAQLQPLKRLFEHELYDVPAFIDLVHYLDLDVNAPAPLIDDLAHAFVSIRHIVLSEYPELVGALATINLRAHRLDAAQAWLQVFEDTCGAQGILPDVTPYSDIIATIDPNNADAIHDVLVRMKAAGVVPNATIFNALLRVHLVRARYDDAFALYRVFAEHLVSNDVTFKLLFRATIALDRPRSARRRRRPPNDVPPRRLFRDMLACHLQRTHGRADVPSSALSVSALHIALRTFMARGDYAAAYVVLRALDAFGFQPNLQTYVIVLTPLCRDDDVDMAHLLALGDPARTTPHDLPRVPALPFPLVVTRRPTRVPTATMLADPSADGRTFYALVPLARVVYKSLVGALMRRAAKRGDWDAFGAVDAILEETGREMIPEGLEPPSEGDKGGDGDRRAKEGVLPYAAARMKRRRRSARGGREIVIGD